MEYRDFINTNMNDVITALNGSITPAPVNSELYRDFLDRKADDVITALNGSITPAPAGDELYRDFIERKFDDVIAAIGGYVPPVTFPTVSGSICTFNSAVTGLPLKSHTVDIDYTGSAINELTVYSTGVNLCDNDYEPSNVYGLNPTGRARTKKLIYIKQGFSYTIHLTTYANFQFTISTDYVSAYPFTQLAYCGNDTAWHSNTYSFTATRDGYLSVVFRKYGDVSFDISEFDFNLQVEIGVSATPYMAFVGSSYNITFDTPIYGGSYDCLTGIVTSDKDSGGGDVSPTYQQTATANFETNLGVNNIWSDTGNTTLQYIKIGGNT